MVGIADKKFTVTIRDIIFFITICIPCVGMWFRLGAVEKKVDVIYSFYVEEGLNKTSKNNKPQVMDLADLNAIKNNQDFTGFFNKKK